MPGFIAKFLLTLLVTNWLYSELLLIWPGFEGVTSGVAETARIPTHDEWPDIFDSNRAVALSAELDILLASSSIKHLFPSLKPEDKREISRQQHRLSYNNYVYSDFLACQNSPFFSGESLFSARDFGTYRYFLFPRL